MRLPAAYLGVIVIWSTTPLAIQWSGEEVGPVFGVFSRMLISVSLCLLLVRVFRVHMPWNREAVRAYAAAALGIYGGMLSAYWAAQYIPSGLISVMFGLTPLAAGLLAAVILGERSLTPVKVAGIMLSLAGLATIFRADFSAYPSAVFGVLLLLLAVGLHSLSMVLVKHTGGGLHALAQTSGGLVLALPFYAATWLLVDGQWPSTLPTRSLLAIGYLALFGSVLGFMLYYYALSRLSTAAMALITLMTPVIALFLGRVANAEVVPPMVWVGTALVLGGLAIHQWGSMLIVTRPQRAGKAKPPTG
ncbi:MAG: DMT family transporter [Ectothiorhodospiraceae bacterium]|nr:DMT family transporter [Ectothiorhodospiraceae bacterium]MCH8503217.1 DMT family transporter [Ectothiorhodospiraceae bacterium]